MPSVRTPVLLAAGLIAAPLAFAAPAFAAPSGPSTATCSKVASDFNGDGYADLAAAVSRHADSADDGLSVLYGAAGGFSTTSVFIPGGPGFGTALSSAYHNDDCYADLVVGEPAKKQITILYGSGFGLSTSGAKTFQASDVHNSDPDEHGLGFGSALSTGDFDGDGKVDIAVGARGLDDITVGEGYNGTDDGGAVAIFSGAADGPTGDGARWIYQATADVPGDPENRDGFGWSLAAGDFDGDGKADLAIGSPRESTDGVAESGGVIVLRGSSKGLTGANAQWWDQNVEGVPGTPEAGDRFGESLTAADLDADGKADLVIGTPHESIGTLADAGTVAVLKGSPTGLTGVGSLAIEEQKPAPGNRFGISTAVTDLNHDGSADLAIGAPGETVTNWVSTGSVTIVRGAAGGTQYFDQKSAGVPGNNEDYDAFGSALLGLPGMLVIGSPGEVTGTDPVYSGAVTIMTSETTGIFKGPSDLTHSATGYSGLGTSIG